MKIGTVLALLFVFTFTASSQSKSILVPTNAPTLAYPRVALVAGIAGSVIVALTVEKGKVIKAVPRFGTPLLTDTARANAEQWEFPNDSSGECDATFVFYWDGVPAPDSNNQPKERVIFSNGNRLMVIVSERPMAMQSSSRK